MTLPLKAIAAHARACYPQECCGLVFEKDGATRFVPIDNIAGESAASARSKADGYVMHPGQQFRAMQAAEDAGERLAVIVHSHPDVGAYFSNEDKAQALAEPGQPWYPDVQYLVVSVRNSAVDGAKLFAWDPVRRDFFGNEVPEITAID